MVFLTDGDADLPKDPPHYPVPWVLTGENCPVPTSAAWLICIWCKRPGALVAASK